MRRMASAWPRTRVGSCSERGDEYNELYLGANYYFYGHELKLQTGVQFADWNDQANDGGAYSGVAWTTRLRSAGKSLVFWR